MLICPGPSAIEWMQDLYTDKAVTKLLEIECEFTDDYLIGHAKRMGLASDTTPKETLARLLPTIRNDVKFESDRIRDAEFANLYRMRQRASVDENAVTLAEFLSIPLEKAQSIAATEYLYAD